MTNKANSPLCMAYDSLSTTLLEPAFGLATLGVVDKEIIVSDNIAEEKPGKTTRREAQFINRFATEDEALAYLADVLVEAYLEQKRKS